MTQEPRYNLAMELSTEEEDKLSPNQSKKSRKITSSNERPRTETRSKTESRKSLRSTDNTCTPMKPENPLVILYLTTTLLRNSLPRSTIPSPIKSASLDAHAVKRTTNPQLPQRLIDSLTPSFFKHTEEHHTRDGRLAKAMIQFTSTGDS